LESFEICQQFLKTLAQFIKTTASAMNAKRGVLAVGTNWKKSKGGGKKRKMALKPVSGEIEGEERRAQAV
jgi:tRNA U34 5-methylaminomethyl-2-thiouridine-forming methyltransferase MnmC